MWELPQVGCDAAAVKLHALLPCCRLAAAIVFRLEAAADVLTICGPCSGAATAYTRVRRDQRGVNTAQRSFASADNVIPSLQVKATTKDGAELPVEAILLHPADEKAAPGPVILCPHGGPHSAYPASWQLPFAFLVGGLGYRAVLVNFRGSTGKTRSQSVGPG